MKLYGGIDLHSNNSVFSIKDETGNVIVRRKLPNDIKQILLFLTPFKQQLTGLVVESTFNWYWLVDALIEANYSVHLANTAAIQQYSGLKYADDNSDADWLAEMLRLGVLPEGYIYPKEERTVRDLMRKRMQLVQQATLNLLSIQGLYMRHLSYKMSNNKIKQLIPEEIMTHFPSVNTAQATICNLAVMKCLKEQIKLLEKTVLAQVQLKPDFKELSSIDGIGNILALTIMLETVDIKRFNKVGNYASYCRCVSGARYSNGKKKGKTNSKNGNKYLAWAFVEVANFAIRYNKTVKSYYQRKLAKTNQTVAIKTVAHKLARACFYVLRDKVPFEAEKAFC
jgi:transposase